MVWQATYTTSINPKRFGIIVRNKHVIYRLFFASTEKAYIRPTKTYFAKVVPGKDSIFQYYLNKNFNFIWDALFPKRAIPPVVRTGLINI